MNTIKRKDINKEIEELNKILSKYTYMYEEACDELVERGYECEYLGTGSSSYICSKSIQVMDIVSRRYLNGEYLAVGICNRGNGRGVLYRGYVKAIVD